MLLTGSMNLPFPAFPAIALASPVVAAIAVTQAVQVLPGGCMPGVQRGLQAAAATPVRQAAPVHTVPPRATINKGGFLR